MSMRKKIKTELGYMKKGAKMVPRVVAKKGKAWLKTQIAIQKQRILEEREIEAEAKRAEREAYRETSLQQARERGYAKGLARAKAQRAGGWRGALGELGQLGESMSVANTIGLPQPRRKGKPVVSRSELTGLAGMSAGSYIFSGVREPRKKKRRAEFV